MYELSRVDFYFLFCDTGKKGCSYTEIPIIDVIKVPILLLDNWMDVLMVYVPF